MHSVIFHSSSLFLLFWLLVDRYLEEQEDEILPRWCCSALGMDASCGKLPCGQLHGQGNCWIIWKSFQRPSRCTLPVSRLHTLWLTNPLTLLLYAPCSVFCNLVLWGLLILTLLDEVSAVWAQSCYPLSTYLIQGKRDHPCCTPSWQFRLTHCCLLFLFCC